MFFKCTFQSPFDIQFHSGLRYCRCDNVSEIHLTIVSGYLPVSVLGAARLGSIVSARSIDFGAADTVCSVVDATT